ACSILVSHLEDLYAFYGEVPGVRIARKHLGWYCKDHPGAAAFRAAVDAVAAAAEHLSLTRAHFERLPLRRAARDASPPTGLSRRSPAAAGSRPRRCPGRSAGRRRRGRP